MKKIDNKKLFCIIVIIITSFLFFEMVSISCSNYRDKKIVDTWNKLIVSKTSEEEVKIIYKLVKHLSNRGFALSVTYTDGKVYRYPYLTEFPSPDSKVVNAKLVLANGDNEEKILDGEWVPVDSKNKFIFFLE